MKPQLINFRREDFNKRNIHIDLTSTFINKPISAMWSSTAEFDRINVNSSWLDWCKYNMPQWEKGYKYVFIPKDNLKVYTIDSWDDYFSDELLKYKRGEKKHRINYKAMRRKGYHAIHFTLNGAMCGHIFSLNHISDSILLNGIDCESTVFLMKHWYIDYYEVKS